MSASANMKRAGSIGAASGAVLTRRRSQARNSRRSSRNGCLQARLEKPLALRWVEPRPALHRGLKHIDAPHFASLLKSEIEQKKLQKRKTQIC
jgi:hypothetical protein